jgi:hypothetical protein
MSLRAATGVVTCVTIALLGLALPAREAAAQTLTTGAIQGVITDAETGRPLFGATVVAASSALQGTQAEITDASGQYKITNLPPGTYVITCYYEQATVRKSGFRVSINKTTPGYLAVDVSQAAGEVIEIEGSGPTIDSTSTTQGVTFDQNYTRNLPVGRTYDDLMTGAAGSSSDDAGVSFSGSSSLENQYIVDGLNTTTLVYGQVGSPIVNEFIEETEIITGGYNAEHGRSTGAVVNVVTRSGSNTLRGSIFGYASPGFLIAGAEATPTQSASIDAESNQIYDVDFGFELGGPIVRDKLWFYAGLAPHVEREHLDRITKRRVDCHRIEADGSLSGCDPAYADGQPDIDPETGFLVFEELDRERMRSRRNAYQFVGKLNLAVAPEHQGQVSVVGTPATGNELGINGLPGATRFEYTELTTDLSAKWTSKLDGSKTELEAVVGWHRSSYRQSALDAMVADEPRQNLYYGDLATWGALGGESQATMDGCSDGPGDDFPGIRNCPDEGIGYAMGGPGSLPDSSEDRYSARLSATQRVQALGNHELKAGIDVEDNRLTSLRQTSGDMSFDVLLPQEWAAGETHVYRYVRLAPDGNPDGLPDVCVDTDAGVDRACEFIGPTDVVSETLNWAAYLRDSWQLMPNLTLNAGVRYEEQRLRYADALQDTVDPFTGEYRGSNAMTLRGMFAPRLGAIYDWTRQGRSKVYGHWGRFYESVPLSLNTINFGGETTYHRVYEMDSCGDTDSGVGGPDGPSCLSAGSDPMGGSVYGSGVLVAPGVKAQFMDEAILGVEYELFDDFKVGVAYHDRRLGRVLEDVSPDNTATYILSNPGEFPEEEADALRAQIEAETDPDERARLEGLLEVYTGIRDFEKPRRVYQALQVTAVKQFADAFFLQASYTYARTRGNFPGLYSPDSGAILPNITAQYDLIELGANREGPLPNDRPHDLKVDGYYRLDLRRAGQLTSGARLRVGSGTPIDALTSNSVYGYDESFVLPRGAIGRSAWQTGVDLHFGYGRSLGGGMSLEVFTDLFNVINRQSTSYVDETYSYDNVNPIVGGDAEDLLWAKTQDWDGTEPDDPLSPTRNRNFRNAETRNPPFAARLGARLIF